MAIVLLPTPAFEAAPCNGCSALDPLVSQAQQRRKPRKPARTQNRALAVKKSILLPDDTAVPITRVAPTRTPSAPESNALLELSHALDCLNLTEDWFCLLPSRLGYSQAVDWATRAFLSTLQDSLCRRETISTTTRASYVQAMALLRNHLSQPSSIDRWDDVVLAISLFACLECVSNVTTVPVYTHLMGLNSLLATAAMYSRPTEMAAGILYWNWISIFQIPIAFDRASPFDTPAWLEMEPASNKVLPSDVAQLRKLSYQIYVRLPRLIAETRKFRNGTLSEGAVAELKSSALSMLDSLKDDNAETALLRQVKVRKTSDPLHAAIIPYSLHFQSLTVFQSLVYYWQSRIFLYNLCQTLYDLCPAEWPETSQPSRWQEVSSRMAKNLMMAWPYAAAIGRFGSWAMTMGWIAAWSVYSRPYARALRESVNTGDVRRWILWCCAQMHNKAVVYSAEAMDEAVEVLVGGPLKGFLVDVFKGTSWLQLSAKNPGQKQHHALGVMIGLRQLGCQTAKIDTSVS